MREIKVLRVVSFPDYTWTRDIKRACKAEGFVLEEFPELCAVGEARSQYTVLQDLRWELVALGAVWETHECGFLAPWTCDDSKS